MELLDLLKKKVALYVGEEGIVLRFGGTNPFSLRDWLTNIKQAFGFQTELYSQGVELAGLLKGALRDNLVLAGYSLGGGIASAAALFHGIDAHTFNAAGLHSNTVTKYSQPGVNPSIYAYHSSFDLLTIIQRLTPLPDAVGTGVSRGRAKLH